MTQAEFVKGWRLLILQPWGRVYRTMVDGHPSDESRAQLEFYYAKLSFAHPEAWLHVADLYAQGKDWPSVSELKAALQQVQGRYVKGITDERSKQGEPMPENFMELVGKIGKKMPDE